MLTSVNSQEFGLAKHSSNDNNKVVYKDKVTGHIKIWFTPNVYRELLESFRATIPKNIFGRLLPILRA